MMQYIAVFRGGVFLAWTSICKYEMQVSGEDQQHNFDQQDDTESGQNTVEDLMSQLNAL